MITKIIKHCLICKTTIKVYPSQLISKKFCSRVCFRTWQSRRMTGENNPAYKGGIAIYTLGKKRNKSYSQKYILGHSRKIPESRYVMEQLVKRPLKRDEIVHHINGNSLDNRPENLLLTDRKHHSSYHCNLINYNTLLQQVRKLEKENALLKTRLIFFSSPPFVP